MAVRLRAKRTTLDIGTAFENHALWYLNGGLHMDLRRVGGAGDGGVDLRGWWWLPRPSAVTSTSSPTSPRAAAAGPSSDGQQATYEHVRRVKVIVQCKAEKKSLGPRAIREMEGVMSGLALRTRSRSSAFSSSSLPSRTGSGSKPINDLDTKLSSSPSPIQVDSVGDPLVDHNHNCDQAIAIVCSQSGFTKSTMVHATSSATPLMLIHLPDDHTSLPIPTTDGSLPASPKTEISLASISGTHTEGESDSVTGPEPHLSPGGAGEVADIEVTSIWWNRALSEGVLGGGFELRRTIGQNGVGVGLWMGGKRVGNCTPTACTP